MRLFDLHCDTIGECWKQKKDLFENNLHLSLQRGSAYAPWRQVFAVFIPDSCRGEAAWNYFQGIYDDFLHQLETHKDAVSFCRTSDELARAEREGKCAAILSVEGGAVLGGRLDRIQKLHAMGVRLITLTWNGANELGSGPNNDTGLTAFGKEAVKRMEQVGMIVDCSHLNDAGFEDLLNIAERPFVASHSNVRACCSHPRNLTDAQFKEIVRRGGLCGLNLFSRFIDDDDNGSKDYLLRHIYHMLELGGEDVIAWGGDMDGEITCDPDLNTPYGVGRFADYLVEHGIGEAAVQKIFFDNAYRFFKQQVK